MSLKPEGFTMIRHSGISRATVLVFVAGALQFAQALGLGDIPSPVQVQSSPTAIAQAKSGTECGTATLDENSGAIVITRYK